MKVYISHSRLPGDERLAAQISEALDAAGHEPIKLDPYVHSSDLVAAASAAIRSADAVVALPASGNPNVFFEIGLAMGVDVPALIAAPAGAALPRHLMSVPFVQMTGDSGHDSQEVTRRLAELDEPRHSRTPKGKSAAEILHDAATDPDAYEALSPADFEDLVARLLQDRGFDVNRTAGSADAGYDLAIHRGGPMAGLWLVECKKYNRQRRVPAEAVRRLYGVVEQNRATGGMLVTSSGFTAPARALADTWRISLVGLDDLLEMTPAGQN